MPRPWWIWVGLVYLASRALNAAMIAVASQSAVPFPPEITGDNGYFVASGGPAPDGYLTTVTNWDGQWYWEIADGGYPSSLPRDESGDVKRNAFAFFPLFPMMCRLIMATSGLSFPVVATGLSFVLGGVSSLLLYRLVLRRSDVLGARISVLLLCSFMCAPVFLMAYSDGLALTLVLLILTMVVKRRYLWAACLLVALAFTRNVVAPFAVFFAVLAFIEWRRAGRERSKILPLALLSGWSFALIFAWPATAALKTGELGAYLLSQQAWVEDIRQVAILRFIDRFGDVFGGPVIAAGLAITWCVVILWILTVRQPNPVLKAWSAVYGAYILLAANWEPNVVRYYLLALPVFWPLTVPDLLSRRTRIAVAAALSIVGIAAQWWWIRYALTVSPQSMQFP